MIGTRQSHFAVAIILALVLVLLTSNLSGFGIWDPWELNAADTARRIVDGQPSQTQQTPFAAIVAIGFSMLDVREWTGRLPIALCGALASVMAFFLVRRFAGPTAALLAALVTATNPLFVLGSRLMLGEAPGFALQGLIAAGGAIALFETPQAISQRRRVIWFVAMVFGCIAAMKTRGALLGVVPPLSAVAVLCVLQRSDDETPPIVRGLRLITVTMFVVVTTLCARAVVADQAEATWWIGSAPRSLKPASFDVVVERVFHAFAPWSALLPVALGRLASLPDGDRAAQQRRNLAWLCLIWIAVGYGTHTLFISRYGDAATFLPVIALAVSVALLLQDVHEGGYHSRAAASVCVLFAGLLIRDFALYPGGPVEGLPIATFELPKVVNTRVAWAIGLGAFALSAFVALALTPQEPHDLRAPYRLLRDQWKRDLPTKLWLIAAALLLVACVGMGVVAWVAPERAHMTTLAKKIAKGLFVLPFALPVSIVVLQLAHRAALRAFRFRIAAVLCSAAGIAIYVAHGWLPTLSAHFSPREIYETYNRLATDRDSLAEYRVGGRAATYYARGKVIDVDDQNDLLGHLNAKERRWAAFPAEELAAIDRQHRRTTGNHLFVVGTGSARITLASNQPIAGRDNESFLVRNVLKSLPATIQHPTRVRFEDKLELLGFDLELPHGAHVGASESFAIKWYFRALKPIPGNYKIFVHVDGQGLRLNGDHEPVDGIYPVRMWDPGDVIVDRQELTVPANYRRGAYTIFMGFFSGNTRLKIEDGPKDDADRARAGTLQIQ